jgi:hypothetical protein
VGQRGSNKKRASTHYAKLLFFCIQWDLWVA